MLPIRRPLIWISIAVCLGLGLAPHAWAAAVRGRPNLTPPTSAPDNGLNAALHYRLGLEAREHGQGDLAATEFLAAAQADPQWADPHFSLAWSRLVKDPGEALPELVQALSLQAASFPHQHLLIFHLLLWSFLALLMAILGLSLSAILIGLPATHHRLTEFFAGYLDRNYATVLAVLAAALPFCLGLGVILPTLFLLALMQPTLRGVARQLWAFLLIVVLALPWVIRETDSLLLPRSSNSWVGTVVRAQGAALSEAWLGRLQRAEAQAVGHYEIPFARGVMELRAQRVDAAVRDFARADSLQHGNARTLNNLAVAEWMRGQPGAAEAHLLEAIRDDERLTSPHYNLAQVLSRKLDFDGANREMLRAGALDFDRLRRHFNAFGMGQALMMQEELAPEDLWKLWREETNVRTDWMEMPSWVARCWESRPGLFAVLAILVLALGSLLARVVTRWLPTYECANCGAVLCRRCSGRRRGETFCQACVGHMAVTSGGPFGRVLLERRRSRRLRERALIGLALRLICPPFGLALEGRWSLSGVWWLAFSFATLALFSNGFWIQPGPNFQAGLNSAPRLLMNGFWFALLWAPAAWYGWSAHHRNRMLEVEASPQSLDRAA